MNSFKRSERVQELLRHEISQEVTRMADSRLGFITITGVHISDDLCDAKVYYSVLGQDENQQLPSTVLKELASHLRHVLGRKLESLKNVPTLRFVYDDSAYKAQRVDALLKQLAQEQPQDTTTLPSVDPIVEAPKRQRARRSKKENA